MRRGAEKPRQPFGHVRLQLNMHLSQYGARQVQHRHLSTLYASLGFPEPARVRALLTDDWRYTIYKDEDWGELYDLKNDPMESNNLWNSPEHFAIRAQFAERLNHHLTAQIDESPLSNRVA